MKTSHKSDELKNIKKGGSTNRVPMIYNYKELHEKFTVPFKYCIPIFRDKISILQVYRKCDKYDKGGRRMNNFRFVECEAYFNKFTLQFLKYVFINMFVYN